MKHLNSYLQKNSDAFIPTFLQTAIAFCFAVVFSAPASFSQCPAPILVNETPALPVGYVITDMQGDTVAYQAFDGSASFCDLTVGEDYVMHLFRPGADFDDVTVFDMLEAQRILLGMKGKIPFHQWLAFDVNQSGTPTISDIILMRDNILNPDEFYLPAPGWQFVSEEIGSSTNMKPSKLNGPFTYEGPGQQLAFYAVKAGRVRAEEFYPDAPPPKGGKLIFELENIHVTSGQAYLIPLRVNNHEAIGALQFALAIDESGLELIDQLSGDKLNFVPNNFGKYPNNQASLKMAVMYGNMQGISLKDDAIFLVLKIQALTDGTLNQFISLDQQGYINEAITADDLFMDMELRFTKPGKLGDGVDFISGLPDTLLKGMNPLMAPLLADVWPNPFSEQAMFRFKLSESAVTTFRVFDLAGRVVYAHTGTFAEGEHLLSIRRGDLPDRGAYFYRIETPEQVATGMLLME